MNSSRLRRAVLHAGLLLLGSSLAPAKSYLIDFGIAAGNAAQGSPTASPDSNGNYWNNVTSTAVAAPIAGGTGVHLQNLVSSDNTPSTVGISLSSGWKSSGIGNGGLNQATPALGIYGIQTATQDYFFVEGANGNTTATQTVTFNRLDPQKSYDLTMFGSRNATGAPWNRGTSYTVVDANGVHTTTLQNSGVDLGGTGYNGNNSTLASLTGLHPTAGGSIVLSVSNVHDTGIYTANQFGYLALVGLTEGAPITPIAQPIVRVDFGIAAGNPTQGAPTASPDSNGNYWNNVTSVSIGSNISGGTGLTLANLVTTRNVVTPISLTLGNGWKSAGIGNGGLVSPTAARLGELAISTATQDYFFTDGAAVNLQIAGLNPQKLYNFKIFGTRNVASVRRGTYTLSAANGTFADNLQSSGAGIGNGTGGADGTDTYDGNNRNTLLFTGLQTDYTGAVNLQVSVAEGGFAYLGVLEITEGASAPPIQPPVVTLTDTFDRWVAQDSLDPIAPGAVLFAGSSSIRRWESLTRVFNDYRIIQRGFGGSQFSDLNGVINKIVNPYKPSAIVVFEGTNDIRVGGKTGETVLADFKTFVSSARAQNPGIPICYLAITPCPSFFNNPDHDPRRRTANQLIANYCASDPGLNLHFLDTASHLESLHDAGTPEATAEWMSHFVDDTHLNRKGYALWTSIVRPALAAIIAPNKTYAANPQTLAPGERLFFDFGPSDGTNGDLTTGADARGYFWNNWHRTNGGGTVNSGEHLGHLVKTNGADSGIRMTITGGYLVNGKASGGLFAPSTSLLGDLAVESATADFFFSTADDLYNAGNDDVPGGFMLEGLNPSYTYDLRLFGSRATSQVRVTEYKGFGANEKVRNLQTSGTGIGANGIYDGNDDEVAVLAGLKPDAFGQIFLDQTLIQGDFAYLNAMEIVANVPATAVQSWRALHFTSAELADPALKATLHGNTADPDGDGRSNLLEYAAGTNPRMADDAGQTFQVATEGSDPVFAFTYRRNLAATDVTYQVEATPDFQTWENVADQAVSTADGIETRRAAVSRAGFPTRHLRLQVRITE